MSGLLALLDDVAAIAKTAAAQVDDITTQATSVGAKTAGILIDDTAVTPKYVHGLPAARELPIVWKIAKGSIFNKLIILLPIAMLINAFVPFAFVPLLMLGGFYLCYEGAEKIVHALGPKHGHSQMKNDPAAKGAVLEQQRVAGAIKTDFILSAEIMTIAQSQIEVTSIWHEGAILGVVAVMMTAFVYGSVAVLVKIDDIGLKMCQDGRLSGTRALGRGLVHAMPHILTVISVVGTAAMLWVGGSIVVHSLEGFGFHMIPDFIHHTADAAAHQLEAAKGFVKWLVTAALDGVLGLALGLVLVPVVQRGLKPAIAIFGFGKNKQSH